MAVWQKLIVCDGTTADPCTFESFIKLIKAGIQDLVFIATLLTVVIFIFAGIKLLTSGGNEGALKEARSMLWKVLLGYVWILAAWLIVYTITSVLLDSGFSLLQ